MMVETGYKPETTWRLLSSTHSFLFFAEKSGRWLAAGQLGQGLYCEDKAECHFLMCQPHVFCNVNSAKLSVYLVTFRSRKVIQGHLITSLQAWWTTDHLSDL